MFILVRTRDARSVPRHAENVVGEQASHNLKEYLRRTLTSEGPRIKETDPDMILMKVKIRHRSALRVHLSVNGASSDLPTANGYTSCLRASLDFNGILILALSARITVQDAPSYNYHPTSSRDRH